MSKPIGSITYQGGKYTLGEDGTWTGPIEVVAEMLSIAFAPDLHTTVSGAVLPDGYECVQAAAKKFGDPSPTLPRFEPSDPGTIH